MDDCRQLGGAVEERRIEAGGVPPGEEHVGLGEHGVPCPYGAGAQHTLCHVGDSMQPRPRALIQKLPRESFVAHREHHPRATGTGIDHFVAPAVNPL
ncbi:hypothetical protein GCM10025773_22350 [Microbacterium jejuense]